VSPGRSFLGTRLDLAILRLFDAVDAGQVDLVDRLADTEIQPTFQLHLHHQLKPDQIVDWLRDSDVEASRPESAQAARLVADLAA
jgi:hypothetical protein